MAEQELAENNGATAAELSAAAVASDIDTISDNRNSDTETMAAASREDDAQAASSTPPVSGEQPATTYLKIKELRAISRARSLRLQPEDLVVAVDGEPFTRISKPF